MRTSWEASKNIPTTFKNKSWVRNKQEKGNSKLEAVDMKQDLQAAVSEALQQWVAKKKNKEDKFDYESFVNQEVSDDEKEKKN